MDSYSLRLLSPFSGTTRIIQQQSVRAISNDGLNWRIQIQTPSNTEQTLNRYILFGLWTRNEGLKAFPIHPQQASTANCQLATEFVAQLPDCLDGLDFPLRDNMEYWLLDNIQQPLALLLACKPDEQLPQIGRPTWLPCARDDHTFVSSHVHQHSVLHDHSTTPTFHRDLVAQRVHEAAGQHRQVQWFHRQSDGSGIGHSSESLAERHLPAEAFPHYLVRQQWDELLQQQLMDDFFHWQSPWLLSLPDLTEQERLQLETQACTYPQRLHALYHLYPTLLQKELITKTLIEAKLKKAVPAENK